MKHIESSVKIITSHPVEASAVKYSLVQRLRNAFHIETVGDGMESFSVSGTSNATSYVFNINVILKNEPNRTRILLDGSNKISMTTNIFYILSLLAVLALSLFPNGIDDGSTKSAGGIMMEAIFFLVVAGFIIWDMNKKFEEPQQMLDRILKSMEAEFG